MAQDMGRGEPFAVDPAFWDLGAGFRDEFEALRETHEELFESAARLDSIEHAAAGQLRPVLQWAKADGELLQSVLEQIPEKGESLPELVERVFEAVKDTSWGPEFTYGFLRLLTRPRREPIFHDSMLIGAVAKFESHVSRLFETYYRARPAALKHGGKGGQKEFSLSDIQALQNLDEVLDLAIERKVRSIMFQGLEGWKDNLKKMLNVSMPNLGVEWNAIREIFERRHCVVHHHSTASRQYASSRGDVELGAPVHADGEYLKTALEQLETLGALLHLRVWQKLADDHEKLVSFVERNAFGALNEKRWQYCVAVYGAWLELPVSPLEALMGKVNVWLARKGLGGVQAILHEVEAWDAGLEASEVDASPFLFSFAKACLLEDLDLAFRLLPDLVENKELSGEALASWPLTAPLRGDPRIHEFNEVIRRGIGEDDDES